MTKILSIALALTLLTIGPATIADTPAPTAPSATQTETIVLIRHGEKTQTELGQLNCRGLNRALALPPVLIGKYGKPDYIFAPNPSEQIGARDGNPVSYVRPLATVEPLAISLGMTVNAQIGYTKIDDLQAELTKPKYAGATIFIAWEHIMEDRFAQNMMKTYSQDASVVPKWSNRDYDSIFVIRLTHTGSTTTATFTHDYEGLNDKLSDAYPVVEQPK